jgi:hypothetical protein
MGMNFKDRINQLIENSAKATGLKKTALLLSAGVNTADFYSALNGKRLFSDRVIQPFANSDHFPVTMEELRAWRLLDEYNAEAIQIAHDLLQKGS